MKIIISSFLISFTILAYGQKGHEISIVDFVKIIPGKGKEAIYFYENNWKVYRDIALQKGYIKSYRMLLTQADSVGNFDIMLFTGYADSSQLKLSEERFREIIKSINPNGPKLLNELKPAEFRQNIFFKKTETLFDS